MSVNAWFQCLIKVLVKSLTENDGIQAQTKYEELRGYRDDDFV